MDSTSILAGKLAALNLAGPGATRPRYRILPAALAEFQARRLVVPHLRQGRRRKRMPSVIEFF